jgi:hypothetical protein
MLNRCYGNDNCGGRRFVNGAERPRTIISSVFVKILVIDSPQCFVIKILYILSIHIEEIQWLTFQENYG